MSEARHEDLLLTYSLGLRPLHKARNWVCARVKTPCKERELLHGIGMYPASRLLPSFFCLRLFYCWGGSSSKISSRTVSRSSVLS